MNAFAFGDKVFPGFAKLIEECGEAGEEIALTLMAYHMSRLVQIGGKLMMKHGDTQHWTGDLRPKLHEEIADVEASIVFWNRHNMTPLERREMARRVTEKVNKFEQWHLEQAE